MYKTEASKFPPHMHALTYLCAEEQILRMHASFVRPNTSTLASSAVSVHMVQLTG